MSYRALRKLRLQAPDYMQLFDIYKQDDPSVYSDRGAVLTTTAFLDYCLGAALARKLGKPFLGRRAKQKHRSDKLFEEHAPLYTLDSKILMGYALDIYKDKTLARLNAIKHLRNLFAHAYARVTFSSPEVVQICQDMTWPSRRRSSTSLRMKFLEIVQEQAGMVYHQGLTIRVDGHDQFYRPHYRKRPLP